MTIIKYAAAILLLAGALSLTACGEPPDDNGYQPLAPGAYENETINSQEEGQEMREEIPIIPPKPDSQIPNWTAPGDLHNPDDLPVFEGPLAYRLQQPTRMLQLEPLTPGEELAILHTNQGDITIRFFPEEAPIAVTNFKTHARNGYYDGLLFHRVIPNFMIQGGCPLGTGSGGESVWGDRFDTERSFNLRHFRGALAMAHAGPGTIGSQFYIVQNNQLDTRYISEFTAMKDHLDDVIGILPDGTQVTLGCWHPIEGLDYFIENGGTPHLDWFWSNGPHPVFAHVVSGMEVVDTIANTPQGANNRPTDDMIIERISFIIYE